MLLNAWGRTLQGPVYSTSLAPCRAPVYERDNDIGTISNQRINAPAQQRSRISFGIDRPHLHAKPGGVRVFDESARHDAGPARPFWHLIPPITRARDRPAAP